MKEHTHRYLAVGELSRGAPSADFTRFVKNGDLTAFSAGVVLDASQCDCRGERVGVNEPSHLP